MNHHVGHGTAGTQKVLTPVKEREGILSPSLPTVPRVSAPTPASCSGWWGVWDGGRVGHLAWPAGVWMHPAGAPPSQDRPCCPRQGGGGSWYPPPPAQHPWAPALTWGTAALCEAAPAGFSGGGSVSLPEGPSSFPATSRRQW